MMVDMKRARVCLDRELHARERESKEEEEEK